MFERQTWKERDGWGAWNAVRWAVERMSVRVMRSVAGGRADGRVQPTEVKEDIGLILPPLLIMLDDYETVFRLRGMANLSALLDKLDATTMQRMGVDVLFRQVGGFACCVCRVLTLPSGRPSTAPSPSTRPTRTLSSSRPLSASCSTSWTSPAARPSTRATEPNRSLRLPTRA